MRVGAGRKYGFQSNAFTAISQRNTSNAPNSAGGHNRPSSRAAVIVPRGLPRTPSPSDSLALARPACARCARSSLLHRRCLDRQFVVGDRADAAQRLANLRDRLEELRVLASVDGPLVPEIDRDDV